MCYRGKIARAFLLAGMLLAAFIVIADLSPVGAAFMTCRADPLVFLSNGDTLRIVANIDTTSSNVVSINYTLHLPAGVTVSDVRYTGGPFARKEKLDVLHNAVDNYMTDTVVTTLRQGVQVTATSSLREHTASAQGYDRQTLSVQVPR